MGKKESIDLGRFQGNALDLVSVSFDVLLATTEALKHVKISGSFDTSAGKVSLKIDLSDFSPTLAGSTISGELKIGNLLENEKIYDIEFLLVGDSTEAEDEGTESTTEETKDQK